MKYIVAIYAVLIGYSGFAQSAEQKTVICNSCTQQSRNEITGTEKIPFIVKMLPSSEKDKKAADDREERIAKYTGYLIIVGILQFIVYAYQGKKLKETVDLSRQEFIATHRPHIIVHKFEESGDGEDKIGLSFTYVNSGTSPAEILEVGSKIFFSDLLPPGAYMDIQQFTERKVLEAGERNIRLIESDITRTFRDIEMMKVAQRQSNLKLVCIGYISYFDKNRIKRETGFYRAYDPSSRTWLRVENSDYEYSY